MENISQNINHWDSRLFIIAGCFMLINTMFLWIRFLSNYQLSILWTAIPAIIVLAFSVVGLLKLYTRAAANASKLAKSGAGFAVLTSASLILAAIWIFIVSVLGEGAPQGLLVLIVIFMQAMALAFLINAIAFLLHPSLCRIGYLLILPVAMWLTMLLAGSIKGMEAGLFLDYYTYPIIAFSFLAHGKCNYSRALASGV